MRCCSLEIKNTVLNQEDRSTPLNVIGLSVKVLASADDSDTPNITLQSGAEGSGPPPHSHPWGESFYVTSGQVEFTRAGRTTTCLPGTFVHVPGGTVHAFSFGPGGGELLEITGSDSKAIAMFTALDREVAPGPPDVTKVVEVAGQHDCTFHL